MQGKRSVRVVVASIGVAACLLTPFFLRRTLRYYTDGSGFREEVRSASPTLREVLWEPGVSVGNAINRPDTDEYEPAVSPDGRFLVFTRGRPGGHADLWIAERGAAAWGSPEPLHDLNTTSDDMGASFARVGRGAGAAPSGGEQGGESAPSGGEQGGESAPSGGEQGGESPRLVLFFYSDRPGGSGGYDIWASERQNDGSFGVPWNLGPQVNTAFNEYSPTATAGAQELLFASNRRMGEAPEPPRWTATVRETLQVPDYDIYSSRRIGVSSLEFGEADLVEELSLARASEGSLAVAPRGDFVYFASDRPGGFGGFDLYRARLTEGKLGAIENLGARINSSEEELDPALSSNGFELFFAKRTDPGSTDDLFVSVSREVFLETTRGDTYWSASAVLAFVAGVLRRIDPAVLAFILSVLACLVFIVFFGRRMSRLALLGRCFLLAILVHAIAALWMHSSRVHHALIGSLPRGDDDPGAFVVMVENSAEEEVAFAIRNTVASTGSDVAPSLDVESLVGDRVWQPAGIGSVPRAMNPPSAETASAIRNFAAARVLRAPPDGGLAPPAAPREVFTDSNDSALDAVVLSVAAVASEARAMAARPLERPEARQSAPAHVEFIDGEPLETSGADEIRAVAIDLLAAVAPEAILLETRLEERLEPSPDVEPFSREPPERDGPGRSATAPLPGAASGALAAEVARTRAAAPTAAPPAAVEPALEREKATGAPAPPLVRSHALTSPARPLAPLPEPLEAVTRPAAATPRDTGAALEDAAVTLPAPAGGESVAVEAPRGRRPHPEVEPPREQDPSRLAVTLDERAAEVPPSSISTSSVLAPIAGAGRADATEEGAASLALAAPPAAPVEEPFEARSPETVLPGAMVPRVIDPRSATAGAPATIARPRDAGAPGAAPAPGAGERLPDLERTPSAQRPSSRITTAPRRVEEGLAAARAEAPGELSAVDLPPSLEALPAPLGGPEPPADASAPFPAARGPELLTMASPLERLLAPPPASAAAEGTHLEVAVRSDAGSAPAGPSAAPPALEPVPGRGRDAAEPAAGVAAVPPVPVTRDAEADPAQAASPFLPGESVEAPRVLATEVGQPRALDLTALSPRTSVAPRREELPSLAGARRDAVVSPVNVRVGRVLAPAAPPGRSPSNPPVGPEALAPAGVEPTPGRPGDASSPDPRAVALLVARTDDTLPALSTARAPLAGLARAERSVRPLGSASPAPPAPAPTLAATGVPETLLEPRRPPRSVADDAAALALEPASASPRAPETGPAAPLGPLDLPRDPGQVAAPARQPLVASRAEPVASRGDSSPRSTIFESFEVKPRREAARSPVEVRPDAALQAAAPQPVPPARPAFPASRSSPVPPPSRPASRTEDLGGGADIVMSLPPRDGSPRPSNPIEPRGAEEAGPFVSPAASPGAARRPPSAARMSPAVGDGSSRSLPLRVEVSSTTAPRALYAREAASHDASLPPPAPSLEPGRGIVRPPAAGLEKAPALPRRSQEDDTLLVGIARERTGRAASPAPPSETRGDASEAQPVLVERRKVGLDLAPPRLVGEAGSAVSVGRPALLPGPPPGEEIDAAPRAVRAAPRGAAADALEAPPGPVLPTLRPEDSGELLLASGGVRSLRPVPPLSGTTGAPPDGIVPGPRVVLVSSPRPIAPRSQTPAVEPRKSLSVASAKPERGAGSLPAPGLRALPRELPGRSPLTRGRADGAVKGVAEPGSLEPVAAASSFVPRTYQLRAKSRREDAIRQGGGDEATERAVERGLAWLALHQSPDGRWSLSDFTRHLPRVSRRDLSNPGWDGRGSHDSRGGSSRAANGDTAATGLALLAFLGHGDTQLEDGPYREVVRRGLRFIVARQKRDGDMRGGGNLYMHAVASFALCEAYALTKDPELEEPARRAVRYTARTQNPDLGGWRYDPYPQGRDVDTSVFGWMIMGLKSAKIAGIEPDERCVQRMVRYLESARASRGGGKYAYQPGLPRASLAMTAQGFFSQQVLMEFLPPTTEAERIRLRRATNESLSILLQNRPEARDQDGTNLYYWYYATLALFQEDGAAWDTWNARMKEVLLKLQLGPETGTAAGSWDPIDRRAQLGGRVYSTAIAVLCLEVYYRYAPKEEEK